MSKEELIKIIRNQGIDNAVVQLIRQNQKDQAIYLFNCYVDYLTATLSYEDLVIIEDEIVDELMEEIR